MTMRRLLPASRVWAASFAMALACGLDTRQPGVAEETEVGSITPAPTAGAGGVPSDVDPADPASGGAPARNAIGAAGSGMPGDAMVSLAGTGGTAVSNGGAAGSAMVTTGGAGGTTVVGAGGTAAGSGVPGNGLVLSPTEGWVDGQSNTVGVQGGLFFEVDSSTGGPSSLSFVSSGPAVCVTGVAGPVQGMDYARDWGAQFGLGLGQPSPGENGVWSQSTPAGQLTGFTFTLTGTQIPEAALRFAVEDASGTSYCAALIGSTGTFSIPVAELAEECWTTGGATVTPTLPLSTLTWTINSAASGPVPFDFCVENLTVDVL
jgi:hypothetical protein